MAQFLWSRAALFVVLALVCFSEMCCAATTAAPLAAAKNTTTAPTTTPLTTSNETTAVPTTTSNVTTAAPTTTSTSNSTTAATNMTTTPSNMTTATMNMTTATMNMTTATMNMTTATMNMTTATMNMTTATVNMTTAPSNMTTMPSNMSTTQIVTTTAPEVRWKVKDKNGTLCMLMDFDGTITYKNGIHPIPPSASIVRSSCESAALSKFVLEFSDGEINLWQLTLNFTMTKSSFKLSKVMLSLYVSNVLEVYGYEEKAFFDVPDGDYYKCNYLNMSAPPFQINLTEPVLQPFVKKTKGGDNLGQEYQCGTKSSGNHSNVVIGVVIAIIVLAAAVGVTYYVVKRRGKPSDPPYARVQ